MKKRYLSLFLAAVISLSQIVGTGQLVHASGITEGAALEKSDEPETPELTAEPGTSEPAETLGPTSEPAKIPEPTSAPAEIPEPTSAPESELSEQAKVPELEAPKESETSEVIAVMEPAALSEDVYKPNFYGVKDVFRLLQNEYGYINKIGSGEWNLNSEYGTESVPMEITAVESENENIVTIEPSADETGWRLIPKGIGEAVVNVTGGAMIENDTSPSDAIKAIQPATKQVKVIVSEKTYRLEIINSDTGTQNMLPGSSVTLSADVYEQGYNENDSWYEEKVSDAEIAWTAESADYEGFQKKESTGSSFLVQAEENSDMFNITVTAEVKKEGETVASAMYYLNVRSEYYELDLRMPDNARDIWPGEETTVTPVLLHYKKGEVEPTEVKDAQFKFRYESGAFEVRKDETLVESDVLQDNGTFTIKRLKNGYNYLWVDASYNISIDIPFHYYSKEIVFQRKNYEDISIEGGHDEYGSYLFVDDENPDENSDNAVFTLNTEKIGGEFTVEWSMPYEGIIADTNVCNISGKNGNTITIDPKALKEKLVEVGAVEESTYWYTLFAGIKVGDQEMSKASINIYIRKPYYIIQVRDWNILQGSVFPYKDGKIECSVMNKEHPNGENIMLELKDVRILSQEPEIANTNVFVKKEEGNDILLVAENPGQAELEYLVALPFGGEKTFTYQITVHKEVYECNSWSSTGSEYLLPNAELKLETEVWHGYYSEETKATVWEKLSPNQYTVTYQVYSYSKEYISVDSDGTVKAKEQNEMGLFEAGVELQYMVQQPGNQIYEYIDDFFVYVTDSYNQVVAKEIFAAPGETVDAVEWEWKKFDLEHRSGITETGEFTYELGAPDGIKLNAEKTGFTVDSDALDGKRIRIYLSARKKEAEGISGYASGQVILNVCQHNFSQAAIKPATCTEAGTRTLECSKCHSVSKTETIPATGHKAGSWATTKQPTCTAAGTQQQKCSSCGKVMNAKELPATGHSFGEWKETVKPTALKQGTQARTCTTCKVTETRQTDKLKATIKLNAKKVPLQLKKSTTAVKVVSMTEGDSVKSWKSSNSKIASVTSKGKITGKKTGTAKITVTLKSGISATVTVKVQKKAVTTTKLKVTGSSVKKNKLTLKKGKSATLTAERTPVTSTQKITYKSSNKKVAAVTGKGKITAKKAGKANITVKSGKKKVVIKVTVKK